MKKLILLIPFLVVCTLASAQYRAVFNHYNISPILVNPSVAGFFEEHQLQFHARAQWTGFEGAPQTLGAQYNGPLGNTFGLGVGVFTERAAQLNEVRAVLNYAFRFSIGDNIKLGTGFSTEYYRQTLNNEVLEDNFFDPDDNLAAEALDGRNTLDASVGIYGAFNENTYAGLSFTNLVGERLDNISNPEESRSFFQHYTFMLGHRFDVSDLGFTIEPSLMMRQIQDVPFMVDFTVMAGFLEDQLIGGLSYRNLGSLGVTLGTRLSSFRLYYTYDTSFQQVQRYNSGTHEVTIALNFKRGGNNSGPYRR